ncbi:MAG TPA: hypothetical protein DGH68_01795 [Bacteroidetes bacterium]|nr:hypothetical protein [Bacteroidota bacterium]
MMAALVAHQGQPKMLAHQLLVLADEPETVIEINETTSMREVLVNVGKLMSAKRMLLVDVDEWAQRLIAASGVVETAPEPEVVQVPENVIILSETAVVAKKERARRRVYISKMVAMIETGDYTHEQILAAVLEEFPTLNRLTVNTVLVDFKNPKYSALKGRLVKADAEGKLRFVEPLALQA